MGNSSTAEIIDHRRVEAPGFRGIIPGQAKVTLPFEPPFAEPLGRAAAHIILELLDAEAAQAFISESVELKSIRLSIFVVTHGADAGVAQGQLAVGLPRRLDRRHS